MNCVHTKMNVEDARMHAGWARINFADCVSNTRRSKIMTEKTKVEKSEQEWREKLTPEQFYVTRKAGTEPAFTGKYYKTKDKGTYTCVSCGQPLFSSETKFDSGT